MIELVDIRKKYGDKEVLKGISRTFELGRVYGIVGENGAGKTTLFRCFSGLEQFDGKVITHYDVFKDVLGYLQTDSYLFSRITAREYLTLFANARGIKHIDWDAQNLFDLPLDRYAENFSTGMKKKLALMAVLSQKNEVFILDEPFNGVDIQSNLIIIEIIKKMKKLGKTVFVSSHIFSTLTSICDEMIHFQEGEFIDVYYPEDYSAFEEKMRQISIGDKIDKLQM